MNQPAAFLDRDGTLIVEKNYLCDPDDVVLLPGVVDGLKALRDARFLLIVVSNQAGVGRGYFGEATVRAVNRRLERLLRDSGITIDAIYYCPHHPEAGCNCRKPKPGMLDQATADFAIDMTRSVVFGDKPSDIGLGESHGLWTILVRTGYGIEHEAAGDCSPSFIADDLMAGASWAISAADGRESEA